MTSSNFFLGHTARLMRAVRFLGVLAAISGPALAGDTPAGIVPAQAVSQPKTAPLWGELSPALQQALAPLAGEWDTMEPVRKEKWLKIGNRFTSMKPEEQHRAQEKMRDWATLTPEQRKIARENYARAKKVTPDRKSEQWQQYQQLPEEQKQRLAASAPHKKGIANLPAHAPVKTVPAIKAVPKPSPAVAASPAAARKAVIEASSPPKPQDGR